MRETIKKQVTQALMRNLNLNEAINPEENLLLKEDLGLDSMTSLTFLMDLEESIPGFTVNPETLEPNTLETIGSLLDYIILEVST